MSVETVFYCGFPKTAWLWTFPWPRPAFVSYGALQHTVTFQPAKERWAADSQAFTCVSRHGCFPFTAKQYADTITRARKEIGKLDFACIMDWMCEDFILKRTGPWASRETAVREHQRRTVASYIELKSIAPEEEWAIGFQGYFRDEYMRIIDDYLAAGVDPWKAPRVVVGSMCKRKSTAEGAAILNELADMGLKVHALGWAAEGFQRIRGKATSGDSMAWSDGARRGHYIHPGCRHGKREPRDMLGGRLEYGNCASCVVWAKWWADNVDRAIAGQELLRPPGVRHRNGNVAPLPLGQLSLFPEAA